MAPENFPTKSFVCAVVQLMDTIKHNDENYTPDSRIYHLHYAYSKAVQHFAQSHVQDALQIPSGKIQAALETITGMVVYCWVHASPQLMAALTIHYTYTLLLDDSQDDPPITMQSYVQDLIAGRRQQHPWWRLVNDHFPQVLEHYGPFCALNIYRSTTDFFEGCWIEQHNFHGYYGSSDYPDFLRRMNGLGHAVGASIWPRPLFMEEEIFCEVTSAVAMMENWMVWVNDLISYYKEFDDPRDQTSLVNNYCHVEGLTLQQGLAKLSTNIIRISEEIMTVFADKDPLVTTTLTKFMHGYVTWHMCDKRYRMEEMAAEVGNDDLGSRFRQYYESSNLVGRVESKDWAVPTLSTILKKRDSVTDTTA